MFYRLRDKLGRSLFDRAAKGILDTPPVRMSAELPLTVLSQVQHKDLLMYLVALKSFARFVPISKVVILNDGSLTSHDETKLRIQVPEASIRNIREFQSTGCPTGGTWERLMAIAAFSQTSFVVQLDSDTLTLSSPNEVIQCIQDARSFTIGTWDNQVIEPMAAASERVRDKRNLRGNEHVQLVAEARFSELEDCENLRYVRGCSGFAGFSAGSMSKAFMEEFSRSMFMLIGDKWREWGSEQVMSNVLIANSKRATVLPHPVYSDCQKMTKDSRFIHFIGNCRFNHGLYRSLAAAVIRSEGTSKPFAFLRR